MRKISVVFGTRPEAIKLAPVIMELKKHKEFNVNVCVTAQHRQMLDQVLTVFDIKPDVDLNVMKPNQSLASLTSKAIDSLDKYFTELKPDIVLVQGDTTTTFAASLVAFYHKVKIGHVEAGLRTWNKFSPFPEEINRVLTTKLADFHFAPTELSKQNLIREGVEESKVYVTGNPVIDALFIAKEKIGNMEIKIDGLPDNILRNNGKVRSDMVLITGHRRENFGEGFRNICEAIKRLAVKLPQVNFVFPVHLNPNVKKPVNEILRGRDNIYLIEPVDYLEFITLIIKCKLILTDSGGVQEEAPSLGKPVLVMRENTERPEAVDARTVRIVGTEVQRILTEVESLLKDEETYARMSNFINPYGDGKTSTRILEILNSLFNVK